MSSSADDVLLTTLDEVFLNLDDKVTWSIQFEVELTGSLDVERLRTAVHATAAAHPMARARLAPVTSGQELRRRWAIAAEPDLVRVNAVRCASETDLARLRSRIYDQAPPLGQAPLFEVTVAQRPGGDIMMLNLHHVAYDGMSAVRLITSIARAYAGEPDPLGGPPLAEARDLRRVAGAASTTELLRRVRSLAVGGLARGRGAAQIAPEGGASGAAAQFGYRTLGLSAEESAALIAARPEGATVNDLLLGGLLLAIRRWNAEHGAGDNPRVSSMMPVNMRPGAWSTEVVSNFASYVSVALPPDTPDDLASAARAVRDQTRRHKEDNTAGWIVDVLEPGNYLPVGLKRRLQMALPLVQGMVLESTVLSNVGRLAFPAFGEAGAVTGVWFTPPCFQRLAVAVGAGSLDGRLMLTLRHLTAAFDDAAADRFAAHYLATLGVSRG